jgi:hypothetical protein
VPTNKTQQALRQASDGLTYQSETDAPWQAFVWTGAKGTPTGDGVRQRGRHPADAPVSEQTVEEFFAPLVEDQDWYGDEEKAAAAKYRGLLETVRKCLQGPKVVRVGDRKVTVYVVGTAPEGGWAGLKTTAVET